MCTLAIITFYYSIEPMLRLRLNARDDCEAHIRESAKPDVCACVAASREFTRYGAEQCVQVCSDGCDARDNEDGNQRGDQTVFDSCDAALRLHTQPTSYNSGIS